MSSRAAQTDRENDVTPYPQEALLIGAVSEMSGDRLLCTSAGLAQFAVAAAHALPNASVCCNYFDLYRANLASSHWHDPPSNLRIECAADLPDGEADLVAFPFSATGDAELTRDVIQAGHQRLKVGGKLYATTDNRNDSWLREQLGKIFSKLQRRPQSN